MFEPRVQMAYTPPMSRRLLIASTLTLLAACGPAARAMPAKPPKAEAPPPRTDGLLVTDAAIGPVTRSTPFDVAVIRRMFPGATVTLEFTETGMPGIAVQGPDGVELLLFGKDGFVSGGGAWGSATRGPNGERIGAKMSTLGIRRSDCSLGIETVECRKAGVRGVGFTFYHRLSKDPVLRSIGWTAD